MDGKYEWADGKSVSAYDSTVVAVHADCGLQQNTIVGYGEVGQSCTDVLTALRP